MYEDELFPYEDLYKALRKLNSREAFVVEARYFYNLTCEETGRQLNVGRARVSAIEQTALRKLRWYLEASR